MRLSICLATIPEIAQGVDRSRPEEQGAGDQGLMFGYATHETDVLMPAPFSFPIVLMEKQAQLRKDGTLAWLRPDAKAQVTVRYDGDKPAFIDALVLSTQHDPQYLAKDLHEAVSGRNHQACHSSRDAAQGHEVSYQPNRVICDWWSCGDAGFDGRKIIVDAYGGMASRRRCVLW